MTIRRADESELHLLKELLISNSLKPTISIGLQSLYWIAEQDGKILGMIGSEISGDSALIRSAAVIPSERNKGIAKALVEKLMEELLSRHVRNLFLFSRDTGTFWQRFGFKECDVREAIEHLSDTPQVSGYVKDNTIWTDIAWHKTLTNG